MSRQEARTWGYNDKGEPTGVGQVWDCIRMLAYQFRTRATPLSRLEDRERQLPAHLQDREKIISELNGDAERVMLARTVAFQKLDEKESAARVGVSRARPQVPKVAVRRFR